MLPVREYAFYGVDISEGLAHMDHNRELYARFLAQFPQDDSVARLAKALEQGDAKEAFFCAHTLKGLSAQLGLTRLCAQAEALCELLRAQTPEALHQARPLFSCLLRAHRQAVRGIAKLSSLS